MAHGRGVGPDQLLPPHGRHAPVPASRGRTRGDFALRRSHGNDPSRGLRAGGRGHQASHRGGGVVQDGAPRRRAGRPGALDRGTRAVLRGRGRQAAPRRGRGPGHHRAQAGRGGAAPERGALPRRLRGPHGGHHRPGRDGAVAGGQLQRRAHPGPVARADGGPHVRRPALARRLTRTARPCLARNTRRWSPCGRASPCGTC